VVELSEIADNDYNLNIRRYADTSPPAEIFDVRAILHGGIPVREVEDTYIRDEILKGFDVSCVFTPRYSIEGGNPQSFDYYDFKVEIDTKEKIRPIVEKIFEASLVTADGDATEQASAMALVLAQLERWWDKYHVSLHQLDAEVATAEQVMLGYLKELGYE
jgi:type I restriction enzyme M protein